LFNRIGQKRRPDDLRASSGHRREAELERDLCREPLRAQKRKLRALYSSYHLGHWDLMMQGAGAPPDPYHPSPDPVKGCSRSRCTFRAISASGASYSQIMRRRSLESTPRFHVTP
jgi:hypothetical protein